MNNTHQRKIQTY